MNNYATKARHNDFVYMLRRTIVPWKWREALHESIIMCQKYGISELSVFIDSGTFTHCYPDDQWLLNYQQILYEVKRRLDECGIVYSLNPNVTQGHGDRGRGINRRHTDWSMITDSKGVSAEDCACCISEGWRDYIRRQWTMYAQTRPAVIWIEDDIRTSGHGPVGYGCFCDEHIRRFNQKLGLHYSRSDIVTRLLAHGTPDSIREQWIDFVREVTASTIQLMTETVHAVSPETVIGLMSSGPEYHALEGRDWDELYRIMSDSGRNAVASRPPLGNYHEQSLNGLLYTANQIHLTRRVVDGPKCIEEGEIESFPYSSYSKSNVFLTLQNDVAISSGCDMLTLNLFDHSGTPMAVNEDILRTLGWQKKYLSAIKSRYPERAVDAGIGVYFSPQSAKHKDIGLTRDGLDTNVTHFAGILQNMGISVSFSQNTPVTMLIGQSIAAATDDEIQNLLTGAVFVDAPAFSVLAQRGFAELLGADIIESFPLGTQYPIGGEHAFNTDAGGGKECYFDTAIHTSRPLFLNLNHHAGVVGISRMIDVDLKSLFPCCYSFKNYLGGKVVVYPLDVSKLSEGFRTPYRKKMMHHLFQFLSDGKELPLFLTGDRPVLPLRADGKTQSLVSLYSLSLDSLNGIEARLWIDRLPTSVDILNNQGEWIPYHHYQWNQNTLIFLLNQLSVSEPLHFSISFPESAEMDHRACSSPI